MTLIDFVKQFAEHKNSSTEVILEWFWINEGKDDEYSFKGSPEEFIEKYTEHYDCIDEFDIFNDVYELRVVNESRSRIYIMIRE